MVEVSFRRKMKMSELFIKELGGIERGLKGEEWSGKGKQPVQSLEQKWSLIFLKDRKKFRWR